MDNNASDLGTVQELEATAAGYAEVVENYAGCSATPDYFLRIAVADQAAYETFLTGELIGLPGVLHATSRLIMKQIKADD